MPSPVSDLTAAEIKAVLSISSDRLDEEQALAIQAFIDEIGGLENARAAVDFLSKLEEAA